jgi:hypothetical protein
MNSQQRWKIKAALDAIETAIFGMFEEGEQEKIASGFPAYPKDALGTDGGLWTDKQIAEHAKRVFSHASKLIRKVSSGEVVAKE